MTIDRALSPDACQVALVPLAVAADPVGIPEIADRLGVARNTVDQWKQRHDSFPAPRWQVGGRPAWDWSDITEWAAATGRLPHPATTTEETP